MELGSWAACKDNTRGLESSGKSINDLSMIFRLKHYPGVGWSWGREHDSPKCLPVTRPRTLSVLWLCPAGPWSPQPAEPNSDRRLDQFLPILRGFPKEEALRARSLLVAWHRGALNPPGSGPPVRAGREAERALTAGVTGVV